MPPSHLCSSPTPVGLQLKAVEKRNSVASDLRESFSRLDVQHRQSELKHDMASCDLNDEDREKQSPAEASMFVR